MPASSQVQYFLEGRSIVKVSEHKFDGGRNMRVHINSDDMDLDISMPPECLAEIVRQASPSCLIKLVRKSSLQPTS